MLRDDLPDATPFVIRPAKATDKEAILAFCEHTFSWGDYLPLVWDEWLADEQGQLLVATLNEVPVGVAKVTMASPTEAWLEGLRVHEAYRRMGLAGQFLAHCLTVARQRGAHVARLATSSKNVAVHKTTERAGMRRVAAAQVLEAQALASGEGLSLLTHLTLQDWPQVSTRILNGAMLAEMGGLYGADWAWQALTADKLRAHLEREQVLGFREQSRIVATAITTVVDEGYKALSVAYVDGSDPHAQTLAHALRQYAATLRLESVEVVVPSGSSMFQAFVRAGYKPEPEAQAEIWIYELDWRGVVS